MRRRHLVFFALTIGVIPPLWLAAEAICGCTSVDRFRSFSYLNRPRGYAWHAHRDAGGAIAYYGKDPVGGWTVYVGPDGIYYRFAHDGEISPNDLHSLWTPHDVRLERRPVAQR